MNLLQRCLLRLLGLSDHEGRIKDLERHFVTRRDPAGKPIETLADVPLEKRKDREHPMRGMSWPQRKAYLEATDGGRYERPSN